MTAFPLPGFAAFGDDRIRVLKRCYISKVPVKSNQLWGWVIPLCPPISRHVKTHHAAIRACAHPVGRPLKTGLLVVACGSHAARDQAAQVVAALALRGPVTVLDGGNRFPAYRVASLLRRQTTAVNTAASRLFIRRAFTAYQVLALLENTPSLRQPYLVLDLLATFYDEHIPAHEAGRLVDNCLRQIDRLCHLAPVAVTLASPLLPERAFLVERVCAAAGKIFELDEPAVTAFQPGLF